MRAVPALLASALVIAALSVAAFAADDDDDVPPSPPPPSVDSKFIAYSQPVIAFTHAEIVDGTGAKPRYDQTLVVKDGRVAALGPASRVHVPDGATVIDTRGKTLLPGFVMVHEHLFYPMGTYGARDYAALPISFARRGRAAGGTPACLSGFLVFFVVFFL